MIQLPRGLFRALCAVAAIGSAVPVAAFAIAGEFLAARTGINRSVLGVVALAAFYVLSFPMMAALAYVGNGRLPPVRRYVLLSCLGTVGVIVVARILGWL